MEKFYPDIRVQRVKNCVAQERTGGGLEKDDLCASQVFCHKN